MVRKRTKIERWREKMPEIETLFQRFKDNMSNREPTCEYLYGKQILRSPVSLHN